MSSFHFSNDVSQSTLDNLQRLAQFSVPLATSFTDIMLEFLASGNAAGLIEALKTFSGEHSVGIAALKNLAQAYLVLLKGIHHFHSFQCMGLGHCSTVLGLCVCIQLTKLSQALSRITCPPTTSLKIWLS